MRARRMQALAGSWGANPFDDRGEDVNPNSYLTNLSDCMLVLACGLMVALVVAWSVRLPSMTELEQTSEMQEVTDLEDITGDATQGGAGYMELGTVYQDPKTGKMYMIQEIPGQDDESGGEGEEAAAGQVMTDSISQTGTSDVPRAGTMVDADGE